MRGVNIAVTAACNDLSRSGRPDGQQLRRTAQIPGHVGADVGGQGQAAAPVSHVWTQLSGTQQRSDSTNGIPAPEDAMSSRFQQRGDVFVGLQ